jgi:hypothetical protein
MYSSVLYLHYTQRLFPGRWGSLVKNDCPSRRRKTLIFLNTFAALRLHLHAGKASGVNLEEKSGVGVPKAVECHPWHSFGNSCSQVDSICNACIPVGPVSMAERGILLFGQRKISIPSAQASALERSLQWWSIE